MTGRLVAVLLGAALSAGCASLGHPATLPPASSGVATLPHVPPIAQSAYQCGPAALTSVLRGWGRWADAETIGRRLRTPGSRGVLNFMLAQAARDDGLWTELPAGETLEGLREWVRRGVPPIIMVQVGPRGLPVYHFLVITGFDERRRLVYANTGRGTPEAIPAARLLTRWRRAGSWTLIACPPERVDWAIDPARAGALAQILDRQGFREQAARWYRTAMAHDPSSVPIRFNLATVYVALGRRAEAKELYEALVRESPGWSPAGNNLAWLALQEHRPADAVRLIQQTLAHGGTPTADLWDTWGVASCQLGRYAEAQAAFLRAEALVPAAQQETLALIRQHRALCHPAPHVSPPATPPVGLPSRG